MEQVNKKGIEHLRSKIEKLKNGGKIEKLKNGSDIHIKPENKDKFTKSAKAAGEGVQEHAHNVMNNPNSTHYKEREPSLLSMPKMA